MPARRPGCARPSLIMNTDTSRPAGWPTMASPAFPRALLLRRNCRSDPWPAVVHVDDRVEVEAEVDAGDVGRPPDVTVVID